MAVDAHLESFHREGVLRGRALQRGACRDVRMLGITRWLAGIFPSPPSEGAAITEGGASR